MYKQTQFPAGRVGWGGKCAKRTQLPKAEHRGGVSIGDCGLGTDLRWDASPAVYRLRPARVDCAKQTQFGPDAQAGCVPGERKCAKRTQFPAGPSGTGSQGTRGKHAKRTQLRRSIGGSRRAKCTKQTQSRRSAGAPGAKRAKRTQFRRADRPEPGAGCANKPNSRRCADREIGVPRGRNVRHRLDAPPRETKPNLGRMGHLGTAHQGGTDCAKRSQFGSGGPGEPPLGPIVQNKPNFR